MAVTKHLKREARFKLTESGYTLQVTLPKKEIKQLGDLGTSAVEKVRRLGELKPELFDKNTIKIELPKNRERRFVQIAHDTVNTAQDITSEGSLHNCSKVSIVVVSSESSMRKPDLSWMKP